MLTESKVFLTGKLTAQKQNALSKPRGSTAKTFSLGRGRRRLYGKRQSESEKQ